MANKATALSSLLNRWINWEASCSDSFFMAAACRSDPGLPVRSAEPPSSTAVAASATTAEDEARRISRQRRHDIFYS